MTSTANRIALIDIDGTLANIEHRICLIKKPTPDREAFHKECINDKPIQQMIDLVNNLYENYQIVLITGRTEKNRKDTIAWLAEYGVCHDIMYMRQNGNYEPDYRIKPKMLSAEQIKRVAFAIDDRNQVVDMWRELGLLTLQCADGDF